MKSRRMVGTVWVLRTRLQHHPMIQDFSVNILEGKPAPYSCAVHAQLVPGIPFHIDHNITEAPDL